MGRDKTQRLVFFSMADINITNPEIVNASASDDVAQVVKNPSLVADEIINAAINQPTEEEIHRKELVENLLKFRVSAKDEFPPEVCLLEIDGVKFFAKGDVHAIKAKQKQGKTNAISIMVAAILSGKWGRLQGILEGAKVLVIDTEQKDADAQLVYNRTLQLAGLPKEDIYDRFQTFAFRALDTQQKLDAVKALIMDFKPDIVFIDGIVDLMGNFNEVDDSKLIIEELLRMSTKEVSGIDPAIVCVLHTNKQQEDHNMRGHAGTMLAQKSGNVLEVTKKDGVISVYSTDSRHQEVPTWSFMFDADGNIVDADSLRKSIIENQQQERMANAEKRIEDKKNKKVETLLKIVKQAGGIIARSSLRDKLMKELSLGRSSIDNFLREMIKEEKIVQDKNNLKIAIPSANVDNVNQQSFIEE